jgi:FlgD Ig-like domain/NHL repeat
VTGSARARGRRRAAPRALALVIVAGSILMAMRSATAEPPAASATTLIVPPEKHTLGIYRATDFHLKLFTGPKNRFRNPQGLACVKLARLDDPERSGDDDELTVYGVNADEPSIIYNDSMTSVKIWRGPMRDPRGIAADPLGRVVVADTGNDRLLLLQNDRGRLELTRAIGSSGSGPGQFRKPTGVALDSHGRIYVADTGNNRVQVLDRLGGFLRELPARSQSGSRGRDITLDGAGASAIAGGAALTAPTAIAVVDRDEPWSFRKIDRIVVVDRGGKRLQSFDEDGRLAHAFFDSTLDGPSFAYIALDYHNNVFATDSRNCRIHKLDASLAPVAAIGRRGKGDLEFEAPTGIAIWRRLGQFFIAEATGAQYYWLGTDIVGPIVRPVMFAAGEKQEITYTLTERSTVTAQVLDGDDDVVRTLLPERYQEIGQHALTWDGRGDDHAPLASGPYRVRVTARATYSSRKHFERERMLPIEIRAKGQG